MSDKNIKALKTKNHKGEENTVYFSLMPGSIVKMIRDYKIKELRRKKASGEYKITNEQIDRIEQQFKDEEKLLNLTT